MFQNKVFEMTNNDCYATVEGLKDDKKNVQDSSSRKSWKCCSGIIAVAIFFCFLITIAVIAAIATLFYYQVKMDTEIKQLKSEISAGSLFLNDNMNVSEPSGSTGLPGPPGTPGIQVHKR